MSIRRTALSFETNYTQIPNDWVRDGRLSLRARGLLVQIMSHKVGWDLTLESLVRDNPEGRDAIRTAINELESVGYLRRVDVRTATNQFHSKDYVLQDPPISSVGSADSGKPRVGEPTYKEDYLQEDHLQEDQDTPVANAPRRRAAEPEGSSPDEDPGQASYVRQDRPDVEQVCTLLADCIEANGSKRPTITQRWRDAARLLIDRDGRTPTQIAWIIQWSQTDEFWRANILSMPTLRRKFDQLRLQAQRGQTPQVSAREREIQGFLNGRPGDSPVLDGGLFEITSGQGVAL